MSGEYFSFYNSVLEPFGFDENFEDPVNQADIERSKNDPAFDYFANNRPNQPKKVIGQYVASQEFNVPLIYDRAEWEKAFDDKVAMLRSEMHQDYDGFSGLFSSQALKDSIHAEERQGFAGKFGRMVMSGLRSGELSPNEYMRFLIGHMGWAATHSEIQQAAMLFGAHIYLDKPTASCWRYIEGTNVSIFGDPNVQGRYYLGASPPQSYSVGGFLFDEGEYDTPKKFRKHNQPTVARPFIEIYEQIRNLALFDITQNPVLELQQDLQGNVHFLQYLKTGQERDFIEPFDLPKSDDALVTTNVRGITSPNGKAMRLYFAPERMPKGLEGNGLFCSGMRPRRIQVMFASAVADFVLHEAYISFQNNHFDTSPLFRPPLAAGLSSCEGTQDHVLARLDKIIDDTSRKYNFNTEVAPYFDIKVTSNGRQAAVESDWQVKEIGYDDL